MGDPEFEEAGEHRGTFAVIEFHGLRDERARQASHSINIRTGTVDSCYPDPRRSVVQLRGRRRGSGHLSLVRVTPSRQSGRMTDDEVLREPAFDGFELEERPCHDAWVWGWCPGDDRRWRCYLEERQAINWDGGRSGKGGRSRLPSSWSSSLMHRRVDPRAVVKPVIHSVAEGGSRH